MAITCLVLIGYAIEAIAFALAFARPWHRRRKVRWDLVLLAVISCTAATVLVARHSSTVPALATLVRFAPLLVGQVVLLGTSVWLVASVLASLFCPRRLRERPHVDFSFLTAESGPSADSPSATRPPRSKVNHRRWVERLNRLRVMHRWSFLSEPPTA